MIRPQITILNAKTFSKWPYATNTTTTTATTHSNNNWTNSFKLMLTPPVTLLNNVYFHWITQWTEPRILVLDWELKRTPKPCIKCILLYAHANISLHKFNHNQIHNCHIRRSHRDYIFDSLRLCHLGVLQEREREIEIIGEKNPSSLILSMYVYILWMHVMRSIQIL